LANAFKNLAAVSFQTDYSFKQAEVLKNAAKNAPVKAAKKEEKKVVEKEKP